MSIREIKQAIAQLPAHELAELANWFAKFNAESWDQQISVKLKPGRLDSLLTEVDADRQSGLAQPL